MRFYLIVLTLLSIGGTAIAQQTQSNISYPSVAAALKAMRAKPGVVISVVDGWTIINDKPNMTLWSFTPPGHPAHPTAVRRAFKQKDGAWYVDQAVLCQVMDKAPCDKINAEFVELNNKMRESIRRATQGR